MPSDRSSRPCAFAAAEDVPGGPYGRIGLGRRPQRFAHAGFRVDRVPLRRVMFVRQSSGVVRGVGVRFGAPTRDRPACASSGEIRMTRAPGTAGRADSAGPIDRAHAHHLASEVAKWDGRPDASLEVCFPFSAAAPRRACAGRRHLAGCPAPTFTRRRRPPPPLVIGARHWLCATRRHRAPTHRRRLLVPAVLLRFSGDGPVALRGSNRTF